MTITLNNREFDIMQTTLANVPYNFVAGKKTLRGIRNAHRPQIIHVMDKFQEVATLQESITGELTPFIA